MQLAVSTHWNASRHHTGEALIQEVLDAGFHSVELGYDLRLDLVPGVRRMVTDGAVTVTSLHNFCPIPVGAPIGHPELFTLASHDPRIRQGAVKHTTDTIRFAAEIGAHAVVAHAGYVDVRMITPELIKLYEAGEQCSSRFERLKLKAIVRRDDKARRHLDYLCESIELLLPVLQASRIALAFENLPLWESCPNEPEMEEIARRFDSPYIRYWHDFGHAYIRDALGFTSHKRWLERLRPWLAGMHIHDASSPSRDHLMPPRGKINFASFKEILRSDTIAVLEPAPGTDVADIQEAARRIRQIRETPDEIGG